VARSSSHAGRPFQSMSEIFKTRQEPAHIG